MSKKEALSNDELQLISMDNLKINSIKNLDKIYNELWWLLYCYCKLYIAYGGKWMPHYISFGGGGWRVFLVWLQGFCPMCAKYWVEERE